MSRKSSSAEQKAARAAKRQREAAERLEQRIQTFCQLFPGLAWLTYPEALLHSSPFLLDVAQKFRARGVLTERQVVAALDALDRTFARAVEAAQRDEDAWRRQQEIEAGKRPPLSLSGSTIVGEVVALIIRGGGAFDTIPLTPKMRVRPDGTSWFIECTVVTSINKVAVGDHVQFKIGRTGPMRGDPSAVWGSHPRDAVILSGPKSCEVLT